MKYTIYSPNKSYTGVSAGVAFAMGKGETDNEAVIPWLREKGYTVQENKPAKEPAPKPAKEDKDAAKGAAKKPEDKGGAE